MSPELLGPSDIEDLADHLARQNAHSDRIGLAYFAPFARAGAIESDIAVRRLGQWARALSEPGWQRTWGLRDGDDRAGGKRAIIAHLDLTGPGLEAELHRAGLRLGVEPAYHRQGVGEGLLREAIAFAREAELAWLDLWVFAHNAPALALYRKMGFVEIGRFPDQFRLGQISIDDVAMCLAL